MIACGVGFHCVCELWPNSSGQMKASPPRQRLVAARSGSGGRPKRNAVSQRRQRPQRSLLRSSTVAFAVLLLLANAPLVVYFGMYHQRGVIDAIGWIREHTDPAVHSVFFYMPCHSTPFYSHVGKRLPMHFLECRPPLPGRVHYDQADHFFDDPAAFVALHPFSATHLVMFEPAADALRTLLGGQHYHEVG
jgi:Alg9-like mannosyltransferase family